ncbi:hypothetical protein KEM55_005487 [Ascosphaera atra]|nr:hypothetical protein KEM55_005487 [Ascosphaera atra]
MLARAVASPLLRRTAALPIAAIATPTLTSSSLLRYSQPRRWQSNAKPPKGPAPSAGKDTKPDSHSTTQRPSQPDPEASNTDLPNKDAPKGHA